MDYIYRHTTPLGKVTFASDGSALTGLWFDEQKYYAATLCAEHSEKLLPVFERTVEWLEIYFGGREPEFLPEIVLSGSPFRLAVWEILKRIPYGTTVTYGQIACELAGRNSGYDCGGKVSSQAVGGAVGHNPVSILVPCHRVVGSSGSLTGYAGGLGKKVRLLELEGTDLSRLTVPDRGTAL